MTQERHRVKLDLGAQGKVIASVLNLDDARGIAAARIGTEKASIQFCLREGEDLWELDPSAFDDVVKDNGVIVVRVQNGTSPVMAPTSRPTAPISALVPKRVAASQSQEQSASKRIKLSPAQTISSQSSAPSSSDQDDELFSESSDDDAESVLDVTASSATVRTQMGPNGVPISSKERWTTKEHNLMFEKLKDICQTETIFYTRRYTEERSRVFQILLDHYGDTGSKGNFLRGRTMGALIARVANALRNARARGEKIKDPFKFFFPDRTDNVSRPNTVAQQLASSSKKAPPTRTSTNAYVAISTGSSPLTSAPSKSTNASSPAMSSPRMPPQIRRRVTNADAVPTTDRTSPRTPTGTVSISKSTATVQAAPSPLSTADRREAAPSNSITATTSSRLAPTPATPSSTRLRPPPPVSPTRVYAKPGSRASTSGTAARALEKLPPSTAADARRVATLANTSRTDSLSFRKVAPPSFCNR